MGWSTSRVYGLSNRISTGAVSRTGAPLLDREIDREWDGVRAGLMAYPVGEANSPSCLQKQQMPQLEGSAELMDGLSQ